MIEEKTDYAAGMEYQRRVQRILSCITQSVVKIAGGHYPNIFRTSRHLELPGGHPITRAGAHKLMFNLEPHFRIRKNEVQGGLYYIEIVGYHYTVYDSERREILAYHWHPGSREFIQTPHLHLGNGARIGFDPLVTKSHMPTGYITFGEVIMFLIRDLSVRPIRSDWETVLQSAFEPVPGK